MVAAEQVKSVAVLAHALGVRAKTLYEWKAAGCPWKRDGRFPVEAMRAWADANIRPGLGRRSGDRETGGEDGMTRANWSARKEKAEALRSEVKLNRERGDLVEIELVVQDFTQIVVTLMTHVRQLPDRLSGVIDDPAMKSSVRANSAKWIDDICEQASRSLQTRIDELEEERID